MLSGTVKTVVRDRGFGFVAAENGKEYFYHRADVADFDGIYEDDSVTFEAVEPAPPKGLRAWDVRRVERTDRIPGTGPAA